MDNQNNVYNQNLEIVRNRSKIKREVEEERVNNDYVFNNYEEYEKNRNKLLDCQVYMYEEQNSNSNSTRKRVALVFHFKHLFDITIEGIGVDDFITNMEQLGLPQGNGNYFKLTSTYIKCIPLNVIDNASKGNQLNGSQMLNPRDWALQALATISLDDLAQTILLKQYTLSSPPVMEPREVLCDSVRNKITDWIGFNSDPEMSQYQALQKEKPSGKKKPVELPKIDVPHVPQEYDDKVRNAVVIRYNKGNQCALIFHFEGDDTFRTVQGLWDEGELKPSFIKKRPDGDGGLFMKLGTVETSPGKLREITLKNVYNGAEKVSGITEIEWAKIICNIVGLLDKWDSGTPWTYVHPPQYTVAPDRTVLTFPSIGIKSSKSSSH